MKGQSVFFVVYKTLSHKLANVDLGVNLTKGGFFSNPTNAFWSIQSDAVFLQGSILKFHIIFASIIRVQGSQGFQR